MLKKKYINNKIKKINFLNMNREKLYIFFKKIGEKSFRVHQLMKFIYNNFYDNFDYMTNFNKNLIYKLKKYAVIKYPSIIDQKISYDGTIKWILKIKNQNIEMVYIPEKNRATLCISSQIGCFLNCSFCYTAKQGFNRNLKVFEIIGQLWTASKFIFLNKSLKLNKITNVVMMGMGEPLLNLSNLIPSINIMLDNLGFNLSKRRITISTVGIVPGIDKLKNMVDVSLAISLHAPNDYIRNKIIPINYKYNIKNLLNSVKNYLFKSKANKNGVTIEYVMLNNINDKIKHAHQLANLLKNIPCIINIIPWNKFPGTNYKCSSNEKINKFIKILKNYKIIVFIRKTRGDDINAACGQLSGNIHNKFLFKK
ncbi:23S rRNA (adenine(2503)-C(2))-methyltransferase RlmN [Sodalis-like secondary symbiont of Drepanosiphum platanoidis]